MKKEEIVDTKEIKLKKAINITQDKKEILVEKITLREMKASAILMWRKESVPNIADKISKMIDTCLIKINSKEASFFKKEDRETFLNLLYTIDRSIIIAEMVKLTFDDEDLRTVENCPFCGAKNASSMKLFLEEGIKIPPSEYVIELKRPIKINNDVYSNITLELTRGCHESRLYEMIDDGEDLTMAGLMMTMIKINGKSFQESRVLKKQFIESLSGKDLKNIEEMENETNFPQPFKGQKYCRRCRREYNVIYPLAEMF